MTTKYNDQMPAIRSKPIFEYAEIGVSAPLIDPLFTGLYKTSGSLSRPLLLIAMSYLVQLLCSVNDDLIDV
jgi:hypothetical protein